MKILHVLSGLDPAAGGVSQAVRSLLPQLNLNGTDNEVLTLDDPSADYLEQFNFNIAALGPAKSPWSWSPKMAAWLESRIGNFDAIVLHGLWQYPTWAVRRAVKRLLASGKPAPRLFVMPHGMLDPWFQQDASRRLKAVRNWLFWKAVEHRVVNEADGLLFTCEEEKLLARTTFQPYSPKREWVVGLGIDNPPPETEAMKLAFLAKCPGAVDGRPYLLFLGRIDPKKGVDLLLSAYARWARQSNGKFLIPDLVIAGPGLESTYGQDMKSRAEKIQRGLSTTISIPTGTRPPQICFPGMLTGDAKWGAFYGACAFVLPSHQENFGIAVAESLACGTPVLISNKVNIWREIESSGAGFVAPPTEEGILSALESWFSSPHQAEALSHAARQCAQQNFSITSAAQRLAAVLRESITSPSC